MNSGLLALAGLHQIPSPINSSPKSCESFMLPQQSTTPSPIRSPENNNNNHTSRNANAAATLSDISEDHDDIDIEDIKPIHKQENTVNAIN